MSLRDKIVGLLLENKVDFYDVTVSGETCKSGLLKVIIKRHGLKYAYYFSIRQKDEVLDRINKEFIGGLK